MSDKNNRTYYYTVDGFDSTGMQWRVTGYVDDLPGNLFGHVMEVVGAETFMQLTQGKAVFGHPGLTCKGPYSIKKIMIEERPHGRE